MSHHFRFSQLMGADAMKGAVLYPPFAFNHKGFSWEAARQMSSLPHNRFSWIALAWTWADICKDNYWKRQPNWLTGSSSIFLRLQTRICKDQVLFWFHDVGSWLEYIIWCKDAASKHMLCCYATKSAMLELLRCMVCSFCAGIVISQYFHQES